MNAPLTHTGRDWRAEFPDIWRILLLRKTLAVGAPLGYANTISMRADFLVDMVGSLLFIDMVSMFETAIRTQLSRTRFESLEDLEQRIDYLAEQGNLIDRDALHRMRRRRNELAHGIARCTADELETDITLVQGQLEAWGLVPSRPPYEFYAEWDAMRASTQPGWSSERGVRCEVRNGDRKVLEYRYTELFE